MDILVFFYAMAGVELFSDSPHFESLHVSMLTVFSLTTLESWSLIMGELMPNHPYCWIFFVSYILIAAYLIMNLIVGIIVEGLQKANNDEICANNSDTIDANIDYLVELTTRIKQMRTKERKENK